MISTSYTQQNLYVPVASNLLNNVQQQNFISEEQKSSIADLLKNYDSSSLTSEDAVEIVTALKDFGVSPSEELTNYLYELDFDAKEIGDLSRENDDLQDTEQTSGAQAQSPMQGSMPPPPPPPETQDEISSTLSELYEDSDDESTSTNPYANSDTSTSFSNLLDYTSRILSLNEDSQQEVLDMFSEYNSSDDKASQASSVRENLSSILANQNNYVSLSLYA